MRRRVYRDQGKGRSQPPGGRQKARQLRRVSPSSITTSSVTRLLLNKLCKGPAVSRHLSTSRRETKMQRRVSILPPPLPSSSLLPSLPTLRCLPFYFTVNLSPFLLHLHLASWETVLTNCFWRMSPNIIFDHRATRTCTRTCMRAHTYTHTQCSPFCHRRKKTAWIVLQLLLILRNY